MLRILYAGTPAVSVQPLIDLVKSNTVTVAGVLTNPPCAQGRSSKEVPSPIHQAAQTVNEDLADERKITILTPQKLDQEVRTQIERLHCDLLVCFAYGKIFKPVFLDLFPLGGINVHPSLLPKYRGPSPIPAVILNQEKETGISIQRLFNEMDSGDILLQTRFSLNATETTASLLQTVTQQAGSLLLNVLCQIENKTEHAVAQDHAQASFCKLLTKDDGTIDWLQSAAQIDAQIRALNPWPKAVTQVQERSLFLLHSCVYNAHAKPHDTTEIGKVIGVDKKQGILFQTACGILAVTTLQWQSKKALSWNDFIHGNASFVGTLCTY